MAISRRTLSSLSFATLLLLGTAAAWVPFYLGNREMKAFCGALTPGSSAKAVRAAARAEGYQVSFERRFQGPDGGAPLLEDTQAPLGEANVEDPQFTLLNCAVTFDAEGQLTSTRFTDN